MNLTEKSETITNGAITTANLCGARIANTIKRFMVECHWERSGIAFAIVLKLYRIGTALTGKGGKKMRLIDADALVETLETLQRNADKCIPVERGIWMGFNYALAEIKGSTTVDAVQVVRCVECKHSYHTMNGKTKSSMRVVLACSEMDDLEVEPDWYCADGENKDDA